MAESIVSDVVLKLLEYVGKATVKEIAPYFGGKRKLKELEQTMVMIQARLLDAERRGEGENEEVVKKWLQSLKHVFYRLEDLFEEVAMANTEKEQMSGDPAGDIVSVIPIVGFGGLGKTTLAQLVYGNGDVRKHFELRRWACISDISSLEELAGKILHSITSDDYHQLTLEQMQSRLRKAVNGKRYLLVFDDIWDEDRKRWLELRSFLSGGKRGSKVIVTSRSKVVARNMGTVEPFELKGLPKEKSWDLFRSLAFREGQEERSPNLASIGRDIVEKCANVPLAIKTIACLLYSMGTEIEWRTFKEKDLAMMKQNHENSILLTLKLSYNRLPSEVKQCFAYCSLFPKDHAFLKQDLIYLWMAQGFLRSSSGNQSLEDVGHGYFMQLIGRCFFQDSECDEYGEIIRCKMHDLVHDLAQLAAGGETLLVVGPTQQIINNTRHVNFCSLRVESPSWLLAAKQMRSFLHLYYDITWLNLGKLFSCLRCVRALDLDLSRSVCVSLPDSLGELKHLRYLRLRGGFKRLPDCIIKLQNLQTLDLLRCYGLTELPMGISKLINLRHLHYNRSKELNMPPGFGQLSSLRALDRFVVGESNGLDALATLNHLGGSLTICFEKRRGNALSDAAIGILKGTKLTELELEWDSIPAGDDEEEDELVLRCFQPPPSLKCLAVTNWKGVRFPSWRMDEFPCLLPNLVEITIHGCMKCQYLPPLNGLPHLRSLHLSGFHSMEYIEMGEHNTEASSAVAAEYFPSLECLELHYLAELKGWSIAEEESITTIIHPQTQNVVNRPYPLPRPFFPRLSKLIIEECPKLKSMPLVPRLGSLEAREIHEKLVKHLVHAEQESDSPTISLPYSSTLSTLMISSVDELESLSLNLCSLKHLTIKFCPDLVNLTAVSPTSISSLQQLNIQRCDKLRDISGVLLHLAFLETLSIQDCEEVDLGDIMDDDSDGGGGRMKSLHSLLLCKTLKVPKEESLSLRGLGCFTTLQKLRIFELYNLRALPASIGRLTQLRDLFIQRCNELSTLPESFVNLILLDMLVILDCPELKRRCEQPDGQYWPLIQHIPRVILDEPDC